MDREGSRQFGNLLSHYRRAVRLTQEALAERAGLSARGIQDLERGVRRPQRDTCRRLIAALGLAGADRDRFVQAAEDRTPRVGDATLLRDRAVARLPTPLTSLIGREGEVAEVRRLLRSTRLMTLMGPGGVGKTRLAIEVAASMRQDFEHGVVFVELAPVTEAEAVLPVIVQALGIRETGGRAPIDILDDYLYDKRLLLVLDNFEHVLPAASDVAGSGVKDEELVLRVVEVLERCQSLRVLVTSREALRIQGEQEYLVPTLRLPRPDQAPPSEQLERYEAVRLFVERARAVRPDLLVDETTGPAIVEICRRLDGLPLAIELAAARAKLLSPTAMLARLSSRLPLLTGGGRDTPARHQTLRATIAWSYNLLTPEEQAVFRRLAVFAGGWTLEAAEAVCGDADGADLSVLDGIAALLDKSLLRQEQAEDGNTRFAMLETIREFALEQLDTAGRTSVLRGRHLDWYVDLVEQAEPLLHGPEQAAWLHALEADHENVRAVLDWSVSSPGRIEAGLRLGGALVTFWTRRGHLREGRERLGRLLASSPDVRTDARAKVLNAAGYLTMEIGDYVASRSLLEQALTLGRALGAESVVPWSLIHLSELNWRVGEREQAREQGRESLALFRRLADKPGITFALYRLGGHALSGQGDFASATVLLEEALALAREQGDDWSVALALQFLFDVAAMQGKGAGARSLLEESLALCRQLGDKRGMAIPLHDLGVLELDRGDPETARSLLQESLDILRVLGDKRTMINPLYSLGLASFDVGDLVTARQMFTESRRLMRELGDRGVLANWVLGLGLVALAEGDHVAARNSFVEYLATVRESEVGRGMGYALDAFACLAADREQPWRALRLAGAASAVRDRLGVTLMEHWRARFDPKLERSRKALDADAATAFMEGCALSVEVAIVEALDVDTSIPYATEQVPGGDQSEALAGRM